jgi:predicted nucleotidyltransferase
MGIIKTELFENINKIVNEVSKIAKVHSIILFGSKVRNDFDVFSDVDLLLICDNTIEARRIAYGIDSFFEISIYSFEDMFSMAKLGLPFIHHLVKEGIVINDDGCFKKIIENLKDTDLNTLRITYLSVYEAMNNTFLLDFNLPYFANVFKQLLNMIETYLCMHKIFIFNKEEAIKKFTEMTNLSKYSDYMLKLLDVYKKYVRFNIQEEVNIKDFIKILKEVLKVVEKKLQGES